MEYDALSSSLDENDFNNFEQELLKTYLHRFANIHSERQVDIVSDVERKKNWFQEGNLLEVFPEMATV